MCGITGWADFDRSVRGGAVLEAMVDAIACRGPDDRGIFSDGPAALGHSRLAVIDLAASTQPMTVGEGRQRVALTFNGEIYNFRALRAELSSRGHQFRTAGDTEVVLHAYLEWGVSAVEHLHGMFAFAVWDGRTDELVLARDRLGIKPLHYTRPGRAMVFASEVKSLLLFPGVQPVVDEDGLREVFSMARIPGRTPYRDIFELEPGCVAVARRTGFTVTRYWQLACIDQPTSVAAAVDTTAQLLSDAVQRELVADVPLAMLLSGGLDSSALTALATRARAGSTTPSELRTITVTYDGYSENFAPDLVRGDSDQPYARQVAEHLGTSHVEVVLDAAELADPLARLGVVVAADRPSPFGDMDTSTYLALRAVREQCSVAMIGEGADEIFGGYNWVHIPDLAQQPTFPWVGFEQWHPATSTGLGRALLDPGLINKLDFDNYYAEQYRTALAEVPDGPEGESATDRRSREICHLHLTRWLPMLLDRIDRFSGACGLEVRVPFCDHRVVEYLYSTPWSYKTFDGREKSLLRAAAGGLLPAAVRDRPKSPFPVSQDPAYGVALYGALADVLADPDAPVADLVDRGACRQAVAVGLAEPQDWLHRMNAEMVLSVNAWLQAYHIQLAL